MSKPFKRGLFVTRLLLVGTGGAALGYAVLGIIASHDTRLAYLRFLTLAVAGHELALMPAAIAVGVLIGRYVPTTARPTIQTATFITAVITAIAVPGVLGYGRTPDMPSALPRDYLRGLAIVLAVIWCIAAAAILARRQRHKAHGTAQRP